MEETQMVKQLERRRRVCVGLLRFAPGKPVMAAWGIGRTANVTPGLLLFRIRLFTTSLLQCHIARQTRNPAPEIKLTHTSHSISVETHS